MLKKIILLSFFTFTFSCFSQQADTTFLRYFNSIQATQLKKHLDILASDAYEGRFTGSNGQKLAANYIASYFESINAKKYNNTSYLQEFIVYKDSLSEKKRKKIQSNLNTENVIAIIEGNTLKEECIVISAHYDHLGKETIMKYQEIVHPTELDKTIMVEKTTEVVYNGADDDGSGTVALLEIAEAFMLAKKNGHGPERTIIIAAFTAEELGLWGSKHYVKNPPVTLDNTVANINVDMIGRVDEPHKDTSNYVYLIGSDRISTELKTINEQNNKRYTKLKLDYKFDNNDEHRYYYRSDHYNFAKNGVPVVFYFNGTHADYHKESDETEKINFDLLEKRTRLIFATAWELANRKSRLTKDKLQIK